METGTIINQYTIISAIGKGGMGEVYLAQDTKLDRKVAIKFLNVEFSKDADKLNRFTQEAKAVSALNHPNILTVYEIGETDDTNYIVTEFIEGKTLRERLVHKESLQLNAILKIGVQVSEALSAAHQAGIIHRDIKPENIMIRKDGYAKVLDFGLAKLSPHSSPPAKGGVASASDDGVVGGGESEDATRVQVNTTPGMVMGTVSYMSPEQARGNTTDARTDIWSLGVVLYEMLAGKVPFSGETVNHTIVSILEKEPLQLENVTGELQRIVRKSLTKDVDMRYQSARDLLIDLKNLRRELDIQGELERSVVPNRETANAQIENATQMLSGGGESTVSGQNAATQNVTTSSSSLEYAVTQAKSHKGATAIIGVLLVAVIAAVGYFGFLSKGRASGQINSIAVLPFENRSGSADTDYLSDGIAESLIFRLSQLPDLKVSPVSSVIRYKGKEFDAKRIAAELGVAAVMSGRMTQRGDNLSISVELIDAANNKILWGEQYDRKMSELLATQREIATTITQKLQLKLTGNEKGVTKKYTDNSEAYQLYLKGRFLFARRTKEDMNKSIELYNQAVNLDPNFALAYVGIAETYATIPSYPYASPKECIPKAKAAAARALELDPDLPEAHTVAGMIAATYDWDYAEAERRFKRALELGPDLAITHYRYAWTFLSPLGRHDEAVAEMKRAMELEPLSIQQGANYAAVLMYARRFDEALAQAKRTIDLDPTHIGALVWLSHTYNALGMFKESLAVSDNAKNLASFQPRAQRGIAYAIGGQREDALRIVNEWKEAAKADYVMIYWLAATYAQLGDKDAAFTELERSFQERDWFIQRLKVDPFMDPLRDDPRFKALLKRLNLPE